MKALWAIACLNVMLRAANEAVTFWPTSPSWSVFSGIAAIGFAFGLLGALRARADWF